MATGLQFKENLTIISGGYRGEGVGSNGVTQNWTETQGDSGSSTVTYWYHDSAQMTDRNSTLVEVSVTDSWTAVKEADNTYKVTIHSVMNFIRRTKVGSPSALSASIFVRRERGGSNIWTSGGCVNAAASATHATNVDLGTYTITLPPGQSAATHGAIYYRSNICGHDNTNPPSIYVDEYWLGVNFRNTLPPDYRPGQTWSNTGSSVQTVTGTSINVSNTLQSPFEDLKVGGDTEQQTYSGKNLVPFPYNGGGNRNGITFTLNSDTSVTVNGKNNGNGNSSYNVYYKNPSTMTLPAGKYYFIPPSNTNIMYAIYTGSKYYDLDASNGYSVTFSSDTPIQQIYIQVRKGNTTTFNNVKVYPMLTTLSGQTESDFEPYVGGTASPNPDYPQEVQTVTGRQVVTISDGGSESQEYEINLGKNLLDNYNPTIVSANTTWTPTENGGLYTATSGWTGGVQWKLTVETGATYQFQYKERTDQNLYLYITTYTDSTYTTVKTRIVNDGRYTKYPIVPDSPYLEIQFNNSTAMTDVAIEELMLEKASTRTTYAPYFTPYELQNMADEYIYQSGNDWFVHKETSEVELSDLTWGGASEALKATADITDIQYVPNNTTLGVGKANNYIMHIGSGMSGSDCVNRIAIDVNRVRVNTGDPDVLPSGRFVYKLATPTDRQVLEPALIAQLNAIKNGGSYTGNTTINVTGDLASPLTVGVRVATGSGTWQSHNRNGGWAGVYNGSTFKEMRTVNGPDGTGDPPTIKHPSGWKNQRKIGLNS